VWDVGTGERLLLLEGHAGTVLDVAFSEDGSTLYTAGADRSVFLWDIDGSAGLARTLSDGSLDVPAESTVLVSPTADSIAVVAERVHVTDLETGHVAELPVEPYEVGWAAYGPDGDRLVTVGWDGATKLWQAPGGELLASRPGRGSDNFGAVAFTADGRGVAVADADGTVVELDGDTLEPTGRSVDVDLPAAGIRTAVDGRFAVTSSPPDTAAGTEVVFGDLDGERVERRVHIPSWGPRANFSPDGARYAVGGFDGRLGVIEVDSGELVGPRDPVHSGPIAWVTFSPDGTTLASMGFDGDLALSSATSARARARVQPGPANRHASVAFHPDGHTAVVGYRDGTVLAYETDPRAWVAHACRVAGRNLTADEWRDAFGDEPRRETCPAVR
jgi:WD40 repeat protein